MTGLRPTIHKMAHKNKGEEYIEALGQETIVITNKTGTGHTTDQNIIHRSKPIVTVTC